MQKLVVPKLNYKNSRCSIITLLYDVQNGIEGLSETLKFIENYKYLADKHLESSR